MHGEKNILHNVLDVDARGRRRAALTRKNALFAGNEVGAENWAMLASLLATCKMSGVNPLTYIAETLRAILDGHPKSRIEDLMPWNFPTASSLAA